MRPPPCWRYACGEFLRNVQGQNAEEFAKDLGWPSSAALVEFLYDRANLGEMQ